MEDFGSAASRPPLSGVWANGAALMRPEVSLSNSEFQIQNEDFPALPGATAGDSAGGNLSTLGIANQSNQADTSTLVGIMGAGGNDMCHVRDGPAGTNPRGIITHPDGDVSNIPQSMLGDQYGMAGLVTYLRTVDNPSIVSLALGYDLTTLGLNLNLSERHLYTTFGGPWADSPIRPHELDVKVPEEYLTNIHIKDKLPPVKLNKMSEDVLFYLFYNCPGEVYQIAAACELFQREWRYVKSEGVWLTRSQYGGIKEQTGTYEKGNYNVFDQLQWRKIPKELKLSYNDLEERPKLPTMFSTGSNSSASAPSQPSSATAPGVIIPPSTTLHNSGVNSPVQPGGPTNGVLPPSLSTPPLQSTPTALGSFGGPFGNVGMMSTRSSN